MKTIFFLTASLFATLFVSGQNEIKQKLNQLAHEYEKANFNGAVLVAKGKDIIAEEAFGFADQQTKRHNTITTLFKTESTGKMFTSVAVLQLVEEGKLDLQKTITDFLPESKIRNADKMKLHYLLTHQSGLTSPWERPDFEFKQYSKEDWWNIIETNPLAFDEPGKGIYYSSSAFEVLAAIVEKVSGMEFGEYCKKNIFEPAGMKNTYYTMDTATYFSRGARPYRWFGTEKYYEYPLNYIQAGGAGGWISCVEDFYHFAWALMNEKLLSKKYLDLMMTAHTEVPTKNYGYALEIYKDLMVPGKTIYGHNGGGMGFSCDLFFEPKTQTIVATMLNMYGNSRFVTRNFMATTFGIESQKPEMDKRIALFDLIDKKGLDDFSEHYTDYLKSIGMEQSNPFSLISMADGYEMLGKSETREKYLNILQKVIPESAVLYIQLGDIEVKKQQQEKARVYYLKARELAEKNEPQWLGEINSKLENH
jgi:CubicO group peptidase (beta-lactamase class C family)